MDIIYSGFLEAFLGSKIALHTATTTTKEKKTNVHDKTVYSLFPHQQGTKKAAVKILKNFDEAITVDIASLDPESLYQRPYAG